VKTFPSIVHLPVVHSGPRLPPDAMMLNSHAAPRFRTAKRTEW
jgi:hypothetical protein